MKEKFILYRYLTNLKENTEMFRHFRTVTNKNCTPKETENG
jgi:hypothetical protein